MPALPCRWLPARYAHHKRPPVRGSFKPTPMQPRKKASLEYEALFSILKANGLRAVRTLAYQSFYKGYKGGFLGRAEGPALLNYYLLYVKEDLRR